jgi:hypothetical protein
MHVTCRDVLPGVGAWGVQQKNGPSPVYEPDASPRGTDVRTGGLALGPADRSLLFSACCGTDAGAATAALREDASDEDRGSSSVLLVGCS